MNTHTTETDRDYTVKTVNKAFKMLELLAETEECVSLGTLAAQSGMTRNGAFRILRTMCDRGLVEKGDQHGTYRLGFCTVPLAKKLLKNMSIVNYAHPFLEELANKHDEAVYLTVLKDDEVLFVDMVDCSQQIKAASLLGRLVPLFSNAAGKVMKSCDSRELLKRLLRKRSNKELEKLDREMKEIRASGVAIDKGGLGDGIISVAVAIRDYSGRIVGAITLIGPSFRMLAGRIENEIIPSLIEETQLLSGKFGYVPA